MSDEEVKSFEDDLAYITSGMDNLSRSQYMTGIEFSSFQDEYKFFMTSGEAAMELESSTAALRYLSDTVLPAQQQEKFNQLIDMYYAHNNEILSEYSNPMESFNKVVAGFHSQENSQSGLLDNFVKEPVGEYRYTIMLGKITQTDKEQLQYQEDLKALFGKMGRDGETTELFGQIEERFLEFATGSSSEAGFRNYVREQSQYLFQHMNNCWNRLL